MYTPFLLPAEIDQPVQRFIYRREILMQQSITNTTMLHQNRLLPGFFL